MLKIKVTNVKKGEFEGIVSEVESESHAHLNKKVWGTFSVEWDDEMGAPRLTECCIIHKACEDDACDSCASPSEIVLPLNFSKINLEAIEAEIFNFKPKAMATA